MQLEYGHISLDLLLMLLIDSGPISSIKRIDRTMSTFAPFNYSKMVQNLCSMSGQKDDSKIFIDLRDIT